MTENHQWITYSAPNLFDSHNFDVLGAAFEAEHHIVPMGIGQAAVRLLKQRPLVDWAVHWLEHHHP